ncbi:MAG: hypothetical protein ACKVLA_04345 [Rhodobacterales bacterium]
MFTVRNVILAAIAGVLGCIANSLAIAAMAGADPISLILSAGREFWSIVFAMALIPIFARVAGVTAWIAGFVVLEVLSSLSAVYIWGAAAPWNFILLVNGAYALVAVAVYALGRSKNI